VSPEERWPARSIGLAANRGGHAIGRFPRGASSSAWTCQSAGQLIRVARLLLFTELVFHAERLGLPIVGTARRGAPAAQASQHGNPCRRGVPWDSRCSGLHHDGQFDDRQSKRSAWKTSSWNRRSRATRSTDQQTGHVQAEEDAPWESPIACPPRFAARPIDLAGQRSFG